MLEATGINSASERQYTATTDYLVERKWALGATLSDKSSASIKWAGSVVGFC